MELVFVPLIAGKLLERTPGETFLLLRNEILWSALIALAVVLPVAAWATHRVVTRLERPPHRGPQAG